MRGVVECKCVVCARVCVCVCSLWCMCVNARVCVVCCIALYAINDEIAWSYGRRITRFHALLSVAL